MKRSGFLLVLPSFLLGCKREAHNSRSSESFLCTMREASLRMKPNPKGSEPGALQKYRAYYEWTYEPLDHRAACLLAFYDSFYENLYYPIHSLQQYERGFVFLTQKQPNRHRVYVHAKKIKLSLRLCKTLGYGDQKLDYLDSLCPGEFPFCLDWEEGSGNKSISFTLHH